MHWNPSAGVLTFDEPNVRTAGLLTALLESDRFERSEAILANYLELHRLQSESIRSGLPGPERHFNSALDTKGDALEIQLEVMLKEFSELKSSLKAQLEAKLEKSESLETKIANEIEEIEEEIAFLAGVKSKLQAFVEEGAGYRNHLFLEQHSYFKQEV